MSLLLLLLTSLCGRIRDGKLIADLYYDCCTSVPVGLYGYNLSIISCVVNLSNNSHTTNKTNTIYIYIYIKTNQPKQNIIIIIIIIITL